MRQVDVEDDTTVPTLLSAQRPCVKGFTNAISSTAPAAVTAVSNPYRVVKLSQGSIKTSELGAFGQYGSALAEAYPF